MGYIINSSKFKKAIQMLSLFTDMIVLEPIENDDILISRFRNQGGTAFIKTMIPFEWEDDGNTPFRIVADTPHILDFIKLTDKSDTIEIEYLNGWYHFKSGKILSKIREVDFHYVSDSYMKRDIKLKFPCRFTLDVSSLKKLIGVAKNTTSITFSTANGILYGIYESSNKNNSVRLELGETTNNCKECVVVHLSKEYLGLYLKPFKGVIEVGFERKSDMPVLFKPSESIELVIAHQVVET